MFKSKKVNESQFLNDSSLPRLSETCNGVPKITSTPLNAHAVSPRRSKAVLSSGLTTQGTPRRYSLSEIRPSTSRTNANVNTAHSPGPLLASLNFKDNVSLYEETRSSGLARRIVLYNQEAEQERRPTHQEKYNSPGLFPIVHLFKKDPPVLGKSPKRVKIKLSSPEYSRSFLPQHRHKILEGMGAKPRLQRQHSLPLYTHTSETGTKSVLDALKEISRKRVHSNEDQDHTDSGKRTRTELYNGSAATTSKRNRADSPLLDSSPKQTQKKFCVYDEFAASKSSSDFSFLTKLEPSGSKRKTTSTSTESLTDVKHVKLVNVETQTLNVEDKGKTSVADEAKDDGVKNKVFRLKVFDDAPLDRIRRSRLAALMGNLAGKDAVFHVKPVPALTNTSKEPEKAPEHAEESDGESSSGSSVELEAKEANEGAQDKPLVSILSPPKSTKEPSPAKSDKHVQFNVPTNLSPLPLTNTSASIVTPIVSDSISKSPISGASSRITEISLPSSSITKEQSFVPTFSFSNPDSRQSEMNIINNTSATVLKAFQNKEPNNSEEKLPNTPQPPKLGGFKFDLKTSPSTSSVVSVSKSNTPTLAIQSTPSVTFTFQKPTETKKESLFSFDPSKTNTNNDKSVSILELGGLSKAQSFNFGPASTTAAAAKPTISTSGMFSFGQVGNGFGTSASTKPPAFRALTPFSAVTTSGPFGTPSTTPADSKFTNASKPPLTFGFGGGTTVASSSAFGIKPDSMFGVNTTLSFVNSTKPTFSSPATTTSVGFGNVSAPAFSNSQITKPSVFESTPTTTTSGFGSTGFGVTSAASVPNFKSSTSVFGNGQFNSNPTTTSSVFGTTDVKPLAFGSSVFGTPTPAQSFGSSASSAFGSPAQSTSVFGSTTTTTSNPPPYNIFSTTTSTTVTTSSNVPPTFSFGPSKSANAFGATTTTNTSTFGTPSPFSSASGFNTGFGSSAAPFGNAASSSGTFGVTSAPAFGQTKSTSGFGSGAGSSAFGKPTNTQGGFGAASGGFGSNTSGFSTQHANGGFSFSSTGSSASPFGFGTGSGSTEQSKPSFNFTGGTMNSSAFGAGSATPAFASAAPNFGSAPAFSAGSPAAAGVFNIGAGSAPSGRPRTQLRAKRRT